MRQRAREPPPTCRGCGSDRTRCSRANLETASLSELRDMGHQGPSAIDDPEMLRDSEVDEHVPVQLVDLDAAVGCNRSIMRLGLVRPTGATRRVAAGWEPAPPAAPPAHDCRTDTPADSPGPRTGSPLGTARRRSVQNRPPAWERPGGGASSVRRGGGGGAVGALAQWGQRGGAHRGVEIAVSTRRRTRAPHGAHQVAHGGHALGAIRLVCLGVRGLSRRGSHPLCEIWRDFAQRLHECLVDLRGRSARQRQARMRRVLQTHTHERTRAIARWRGRRTRTNARARSHAHERICNMPIAGAPCARVPRSTFTGPCPSPAPATEPTRPELTACLMRTRTCLNMFWFSISRVAACEATTRLGEWVGAWMGSCVRPRTGQPLPRHPRRPPSSAN